MQTSIQKIIVHLLESIGDQALGTAIFSQKPKTFESFWTALGLLKLRASRPCVHCGATHQC